jgi:predicted MPP superfamily phosphohydrolase
MFAAVLYNVLMLIADVAAIFQVRRFRSALGLLAAGVFVGVIGAVAAMAIGLRMVENNFAALALLANTVFFHGPLVLIASAVLLRRDAKVLVAACLALVAIVAAVGVDAYFIEPTWLEVTHHKIESPKLRAPLRIAVVADLQSDNIGEYERSVLARAMAEKPDLILFAGDYLQVGDRAKWTAQRDRLREILAELKFGAPLGAYAVAGNVDRSDWAEIFAGSGVEAIGATRTMDLARDDLRLTGLSMLDSFESVATLPESDRYHVCLGHSPDFALNENIAADLLVAGHTHGGQVQVPLVGPILTLARVPRRWAAGMTDLGGGRRLVVSRGIGMERGHAPRVRFLCRPELIILEIAPPSVSQPGPLTQPKGTAEGAE